MMQRARYLDHSIWGPDILYHQAAPLRGACCMQVTTQIMRLRCCLIRVVNHYYACGPRLLRFKPLCRLMQSIIKWRLRISRNTTLFTIRTAALRFRK